MVWVRSIYGWGPAPDQQLSAPNAVAAGPDGLIWSNSANRLAVAFNRDGPFDRLLMSSPATSTSKPATRPPGRWVTTPEVAESGESEWRDGGVLARCRQEQQPLHR